MRSKTANVVPTAGRRPAAGVLLIFTGFLLFAFFGFGDNAYAAEENLYDTATDSGGSFAIGSADSTTFAGQSFVTTISWQYARFNACIDGDLDDLQDVQMFLYNAGGGSSNLPVGSAIASGTTHAGNSLPNSPDCTDTNDRTTFVIDAGSLLSAGNYALVFQRSSGTFGSDFPKVKRSTLNLEGSDFYPVRYIESSDSWNDFGANNEVMSGSIDVSTDPFSPPPTPDAIVSPVDAATITEAPFAASGTCDSGTHLFMRVEILDPNTDQVMETRLAQCTMDAWSVPDMGATLWNDTGWVLNLHATDNFSKVQPPADTITFDLNDTGNTNPPPPTVDTQCDVDNAVMEGLCNILIWLFVPSQAALAGIVDLWDEVRLKPPLGYFSAVYDSLNSLDQGTSSLELEGTSALSVWFDPIRDALTGFFWLLGGVYAIRRISHLDL